MNRKKGKQLRFERVNGWGGKRQKAGRINRTKTVNHMKRPEINLKTPLHITLRLQENLSNIRNKILFSEFKNSVRKARGQGLYIIHFSLQQNHIHLIAEAHNNKSLALGMRSLAGRFAKFVRNYSFEQAALKSRVKNSLKEKAVGNIKKTGSVFSGRYHLHVLKAPREVKNALEYVLLNTSKHQKLIEYIDHFSSARYFDKWKELLGHRYRSLIKGDAEFFREYAKKHEDISVFANRADTKIRSNKPDDDRDILSAPRSWLARTGWLRAC